jgi:TM2 domain-containing membrane protein YozV
MHLGTKSALLSGLILPGLGQIYLKYYFRGAAYSITTMGCLYLIIKKMFHIFEVNIENIFNSSKGIADFQSIILQAQEISKKENLLLYDIASYIILACWIV